MNHRNQGHAAENNMAAISHNDMNQNDGEVEIIEQRECLVDTENIKIHRGETIGDQYVVLDRLGAGTYGQVLKVRCETNRSLRAMKVVIDNHGVGKREHDIIKHLNPFGYNDFNIIRCLHAFDLPESNCFVFVFDLLEVDLEKFLWQHDAKRLSLNEIRPIGYQVLVALNHLHGMGYIHADLKPNNIMFSDTRENNLRVKLIDFGCAESFEEDRRKVKISALPYRAPEVIFQIKDRSLVDVWSFGCILAELFLGTRFFDARSTENELLYSIQQAVGDPPSWMVFNDISVARKYYEFDDSTYILKETSPKPEPHIRYPRLSNILKNVVDEVRNRTTTHDRVHFERFLMKIFVIDIKERPVAGHIMKDPFFFCEHLFELRLVISDDFDADYVREARNNMHSSPHWVAKQREKLQVLRNVGLADRY